MSRRVVSTMFAVMALALAASPSVGAETEDERRERLRRPLPPPPARGILGSTTGRYTVVHPEPKEPSPTELRAEAKRQRKAARRLELERRQGR